MCGKKSPEKILTKGLMRLVWKRHPSNYLQYCLICTFVMLPEKHRNWHFGNITKFISCHVGIVIQSTYKMGVPERCIYRDTEKSVVVLAGGSKHSWSV